MGVRIFAEVFWATGVHRLQDFTSHTHASAHADLASSYICFTVREEAADLLATSTYSGSTAGTAAPCCSTAVSSDQTIEQTTKKQICRFHNRNRQIDCKFAARPSQQPVVCTYLPLCHCANQCNLLTFIQTFASCWRVNTAACPLYCIYLHWLKFQTSQTAFYTLTNS
jgi:hypothetical protein